MPKKQKLSSRTIWIVVAIFLISLIAVVGDYEIRNSLKKQQKETGNSQDSRGNNTAQIANPASVKCEQDGGTLKIVDGQGGQYGLCFFPDQTVCEEWAYYRGECKKGYCSYSCGAIGTRSEGYYDCNEKLLYYENCEN